MCIPGPTPRLSFRGGVGWRKLRMESGVIAYGLLFVFPVAMILAALSDLRSLTIPNRISLVLLAVFAVLAPLSGMSLENIGLHVAAFALVLAIGIAFFAFGWFGGGDAKLLAAGALWVGFGQLLPFIFYTTAFGGVLILAIILYRQLVPAEAVSARGIDWASRLHKNDGGVPYGIAIASSALTVFPSTEIFALVFA